jgi:hypothetical protein
MPRVIDQRHGRVDRAIDFSGDDMNSRRLFLAAAVVAAWLPTSAAHAYLTKQVRDWTVECSNGLTCKMSFSDSRSKGVQTVGFQRKGAPNAPVDLRLLLASDFSPDMDPGVAYRFTVDGKELLALSARDLTQQEHADIYFYSDQAKVPALMAAMEAGKSAEVTVSGKAGSQVLAIKLDGVKGAMLHVDEVQGRLGRIDALEAKGDRPPPRRATAKDILTLEDMPEIVRKDFTDSGGPCSDLEPETIKQFEGFQVTVDRAEFLGVPCATGGAYNQPYALYIVNEAVERISFPYMQDGVPTTMSTAMNLDFDPATKTMTSFFRGRGGGDCGQFFKWRVNDRGSSLGLLEMRAKGECDGGGNDPTKFPLVWKAGQ